LIASIPIAEQHLHQARLGYSKDCLPFGLALSMGYFTVPVTTFIFYVLASLELIAEEIEEPFGNDSNDLSDAEDR